ncbi:MAG: ATP-binding cassette domain-containing protein [Bacilli bacterium]
MDSIISLKNINFYYKDKEIFKDFNLEIEKGSFTTIIGTNGSGKSTLVRIILGLLVCEGEIVINNNILNNENLKNIISKIGVVFENPDDQFVAETVMDDIAFSLENMNIEAKEIKSRINKISKLIGINDILEREPHSLSGGEKQLVALASALVTDPDILILDEAFTMIDTIDREKIYKILEKLNKISKITIINITHDMDEILYGKNLVVIDKGNIVLNGPKEYVFLEEKTFNKLGLKLPFMVELTTKLEYYGLIDHLVFDMEELVDLLWK